MDVDIWEVLQWLGLGILAIGYISLALFPPDGPGDD